MKPFVIGMFLLILCPSWIFAQSSATSSSTVATKAPTCEGLARACNAAADELIAARKLIVGYENAIIAHDARIEIARKEIETLKSIGALEAERAMKLEAVISAEREAKEALRAKIDLQEKRISKLERSAGRWRRFALITGTAAAVGILVAIGK